jgi:signal transduction histidine kinase
MTRGYDDTSEASLAELVDWLGRVVAAGADPLREAPPELPGLGELTAAIMTFAAHVRAQAQDPELAVAEERDRIARHLNETVVHRSFALGMSLQLIISREPRLADHLRPLVDDADAIIHAARELIFRIVPPDPGRS